MNSIKEQKKIIDLATRLEILGEKLVWLVLAYGWIMLAFLVGADLV